MQIMRETEKLKGVAINQVAIEMDLDLSQKQDRVVMIIMLAYVQKLWHVAKIKGAQNLQLSKLSRFARFMLLVGSHRNS